jgi:HAD superfamily hydrolase (TIGR01509 family)
MSIKAVLFDLDDTLWPVEALIMQAELTLHQWMDVHAPGITEHHTIESLRKRRQALVKTNPRFEYDLWALRHTMLSQVFHEYGSDQKMADQAMAVFADARNKVQLYDEVIPVLNQLQTQVSLGSISNGFADLQAIGLAPYFKVSLAAHSFGCAKPDSRIFTAACAALNLLPQQVLFVGDDLALDVAAAQQVGMQGVWMNRRNLKPEDTRHQHVKPDVTISNLHQIFTYL